MTRMFLIRHAECLGNLHGRWAGQADSPLTAAGLAQARQLATRLAALAPDIAYTSDLRRALATARVALRGLRVPVVLEPDLRELNIGEWEGLTPDEIAVRFPESYAQLRRCPDAMCAPGGESTAALSLRVVRALDRIAAAHPHETVAVFTHGVVLRALAYAVTGEIESWRLPVHNTAIAEVVWSAQARRLVYWNATGHLAETAAAA